LPFYLATLLFASILLPCLLHPHPPPTHPTPTPHPPGMRYQSSVAAPPPWWRRSQRQPRGEQPRALGVRGGLRGGWVGSGWSVAWLGCYSFLLLHHSLTTPDTHTPKHRPRWRLCCGVQPGGSISRGRVCINGRGGQPGAARGAQHAGAARTAATCGAAVACLHACLLDW